MTPRRYVCEPCGELIRNDDREIAHRPGMYPSKVWHFRCLSMDEAISTRLSEDDLAWYNTWHISRLIKENTVLRLKNRDSR